jgi:limonene-1,2-epoxide hydrolase
MRSKDTVPIYNFGVIEEQARSWRLLSERLAAETDERLRSNLEVVARHVEAEVGGDIPALMATLVPQPAYEFLSDSGSSAVSGFAAVKALYERAVEYGRNRREFELSLVLADRDHVVTEGALRQVMSGSHIKEFGIEYEREPAPGGWYLTEALTLIVWPITPEGLISGERVYYAQKERILKRITPDEYLHLGSLDRVAS